MDRRNFLKTLVGAVVAPSVVLKSLGSEQLPQTNVIKKARQTGLTDAHLRELIQMTLKDLPKNSWEKAWEGEYYSFSEMYMK